MDHSVTLRDRLRIERSVWALDQRLYDLPRRSRIATRREVRQNLLTAAHDVGATEALHHLGNSRQLAAEYRSAEFGDQARPAWMAAALFLLTGQLVLTSLLSEAAQAFGDGIVAASPNATGTFSWHGIPYLQDAVRYTVSNGERTSVGGAWTPLAWIIWIAATILVGRLWRVVSIRRRREVR
ncbi:MAG: hypothetical protein JWL72_2365 [Ilumatobacteraceae bacterium]|nr:hypothetical protein [Ilumatobacteraceae bacterium]MCU1389027.1 hypothetical protein [Ilumatobacteraceae bacterium]